MRKQLGQGVSAGRPGCTLSLDLATEGVPPAVPTPARRLCLPGTVIGRPRACAGPHVTWGQGSCPPKCPCTGADGWWDCGGKAHSGTPWQDPQGLPSQPSPLPAPSTGPGWHPLHGLLPAPLVVHEVNTPKYTMG